MTDLPKCSINLALHAAAASSTPHSLLWNKKNEVIFASHGVLNFHKKNEIRTLRSSSIYAKINCIAQINSEFQDGEYIALGYNNGSISIWNMNTMEEEVILNGDGKEKGGIRTGSIVALQGLLLSSGELFLISSSTFGLSYHFLTSGSWKSSFFQSDSASFNCVSVNMLQNSSIIILYKL